MDLGRLIVKARSHSLTLSGIREAGEAVRLWMRAEADLDDRVAWRRSRDRTDVNRAKVGWFNGQCAGPEHKNGSPEVVCWRCCSVLSNAQTTSPL